MIECIKTLHPEISRFIQSILFNNGYSWPISERQYKYLDRDVLYLNNDRTIGHSDLSYCNGPAFNEKYKFISLEEFIKKYANPIKIGGHVVEIHPTYISVGCEKVSIGTIKDILSRMENCNVK